MNFEFKSWDPNCSYKRGIVRRWFGELWEAAQDVAAGSDSPDKGGPWILTSVQDWIDRVSQALV